MALLFDLSCKFAVAAEVFCTCTLLSYDHLFQPRFLQTRDEKKSGRSSKEPQVPFKHGDVPRLMIYSSVASFVGALGSIPYLALAKNVDLGTALGASSVAVALTLPYHVALAIKGGDSAAKDIPDLLVAVACTTAGIYMAGAFSTALIPYSLETTQLLNHLQNCILITGIGHFAVLSLIFCNRHSIGCRFILRQQEQRDSRSTFEPTKQQVLGNLSNGVLVLSALMMDYHLSLSALNWAIIDLVMLFSLPSLPSALAFLQPEYQRYDQSESNDVITRWLPTVVTVGLAFIIFPETPLSWAVACWEYRAFSHEWKVLFIPFMERESFGPAPFAPCCCHYSRNSHLPSPPGPRPDTAKETGKQTDNVEVPVTVSSGTKPCSALFTSPTPVPKSAFPDRNPSSSNPISNGRNSSNASTPAAPVPISATRVSGGKPEGETSIPPASPPPADLNERRALLAAAALKRLSQTSTSS